MTARLHALLALAALAACAPTTDRTAARVAAPAQVALPVVSAEPPATAPPVEAPAVEPAPPPPATPAIGAPLALAPLNPDPILMRATPDALPPPAAPVKADPVVAPASQDEIRLIQETLADQHLYRGPLDGLFTAELRDAVQRYQRRKGLPETAQLDPETLHRLDAEASGEESYGEAGAKPAEGTGR